MCSTENIDKTIERMIDDEAKTFGRIFATPEDKDQSVARIAALRASMSPQCTCEKDHKN